jgi:hypothetical protein
MDFLKKLKKPCNKPMLDPLCYGWMTLMLQVESRQVTSLGKETGLWL